MQWVPCPRVLVWACLRYAASTDFFNSSDRLTTLSNRSVALRIGVSNSLSHSTARPARLNVGSILRPNRRKVFPRPDSTDAETRRCFAIFPRATHKLEPFPQRFPANSAAQPATASAPATPAAQAARESHSPSATSPLSCPSVHPSAPS